MLKFDGYRKRAGAGRQAGGRRAAAADARARSWTGSDLTASQHFTQPPPRYNEASLVKALEKEGIGRPSTYATIIGKITSRSAATSRCSERRFYATEIGKMVTDLLVEHFPKIMDLKFTSHFEEELDDIETGKMQLPRRCSTSSGGRSRKALTEAEDEDAGQARPRDGREVPEVRPAAGRELQQEDGPQFVGCSGFKEGCKYIKPARGRGGAAGAGADGASRARSAASSMLQRTGRRGRRSSAARGYPECKTTMNLDAEGKPVLTAKPTEHNCEKCGKPMVLREGRRGPFLACTGYPKCKNAKDVDARATRSSRRRRASPARSAAGRWR